MEDSVLEGDAMMTEADIDLVVLDHSGSVQKLSDRLDIDLVWEILVDCSRFDHLQEAEVVSPDEEEEDNSLLAAAHLMEVDMYSDDPLLPSSCSSIIG